MWVAVWWNLAASIPVTNFISILIREILLLCTGSKLFGCLGLDPNTISEVRCDIVGTAPLKMAWTICMSGPAILSQHT